MCYICRMVDATRSIRLPDDMWYKMRKLADMNERSVGAEFRLAVKDYLFHLEATERNEGMTLETRSEDRK